MTRFTTAACIVIIVTLFTSALHGEPIPYTNYSGSARTAGSATESTWEMWYAEGPWVWYSGPDDPPAPFWNANTTAVEEISMGPPTIDADLVAIIPYAGTVTLRAHEEGNPEAVIGTMVWSSVGSTGCDYNASRAIVDEDTGLIMLKLGQPLLPEGQPDEIYTFVEETGVFATDGIVPVPVNGPDDAKTFYSGWVFLPLIESLPLQENILTAPIIGAFAQAAWTGHYVPEPSTLVLLSVGAIGLLAYAWRKRRCC